MVTITLPPDLERIVTAQARQQGTTPDLLAIDSLTKIYLPVAEAGDNSVGRSHQAEHLTTLRVEYQRLAGKELARTITPEETARLEEVAGQLSDGEMESEAGGIWEEQAEKMNVLLRELKGTLLAFPDRKESVR